MDVAEYLSTGIPGRHCHGGIGYVTKVGRIESNTIISVKYSSTAKSTSTELGIPLLRFKAEVLPFQYMTIQPKRAPAAKPMEVDSNQDTVNSTIPIINALKKNRKQKKRWRPKQVGVKKGSENYHLSLDNFYSQMCAAIGLRGETEIFLKDTGVMMARIAEAWGIGPNQSCDTYHKLYN